jgi:two-component system chemotaxis response regulator CheY
MGKKVLSVDDSPTIRKLVHKALDPAGYEVHDAENGKEALAIADESFDLYVVDVNMPEMDGFEFVGAIKSKPELASTPVIFLTTESSTEKKDRGKTLGVNGWIVKPFEPDALVKVVKMLTD